MKEPKVPAPQVLNPHSLKDKKQKGLCDGNANLGYTITKQAYLDGS